MAVKKVCDVRAPLLLLSCLGLVACGESVTAGSGSTTNDVPSAEVLSIDAAPTDVAVEETGGIDSGPTDANRIDADVTDVAVTAVDGADAGFTDMAATEVGGADAGAADSGARDAGEADVTVIDVAATEVGGSDVGVVDVSPGDVGGGTDRGTDVVPDAGTDAVPSADVPVCIGTHPLLDAGARFCGPGQCYCPTSGTNGDSCLPMETAAACCTGRSVTCTGGGDAGPMCPTGTHPLLDAGARFCGPGQCYCPPTGTSGDSCLPREMAAACCPGRSVTCASGDAGTTCPAGTHPLLDAGARFCTSGSCYCPSSDACRPVAVARMCCPTAVVCD